MKVVAIVQARVGSTRLPGKVLLELGGKTVLHHVLARCRSIANVDAVICAVPDEPASASLEAVAADCGVRSFRGSEKDVLSRYAGAAQEVAADIVVRVTSDCPLIDAGICGSVVALLQRERSDYAANNMPRTFPHGLDCEAFTISALERAVTEAEDEYDREHVTPWMRRAEDFRRVNLTSSNPALAEYRWTLDYPEDIEFFRAVFEAMPAGSDLRMEEVLKLLNRQPEIGKINACRRIGGQP